MSAVEIALSAACILLTEDHHLGEAFSASRRGRKFFRPDYDREPVETSAHLDQVELDADKAAVLCDEAGLSALADWCRKIANRISYAKRMGVKDAGAVDDLKVLTCPARAEFYRVCDEHESACSRI